MHSKYGYKKLKGEGWEISALCYHHVKQRNLSPFSHGESSGLRPSLKTLKASWARNSEFSDRPFDFHLL